MLTPRIIAALASLLAGIGVALGAFGAHALKARVPPTDLAIFETGVRYHLIHAVALLAVAWAADRWPGPLAGTAALFLVVGVVIFSGSLYTLVLTGPRWMGAITPLGGVALICGWLCLAWHLFTAPGGPR